MKTFLLISLATLVILSSCRRDAGTTATHVLSIAAFKMDKPGQNPSAAELVALKAFALSRYNPYSEPVAIDDDQLDELGFHLMLVVNRETSKIDGVEEICSQGLAWGSEPKALEVFRKPVQGGIEIHAISSGRRGNAMPSNISFSGYEDIGVHVFDDGLVISWATKPIAHK